MSGVDRLATSTEEEREAAVTAAAGRGVRYAGMGQGHLNHLREVGMPPNSQGYEMDGDEIDEFRANTGKLAAKAKL